MKGVLSGGLRNTQLSNHPFVRQLTSFQILLRGEQHLFYGPDFRPPERIFAAPSFPEKAENQRMRPPVPDTADGRRIWKKAASGSENEVFGWN
ncbi:hypothetical protein [Larkinella soli]|uniref:hypothetical protein n=1 Tax=Larkinella soli TaxID=1770527 RepID=UPI000FFC0E86|nr:hypothetical protein [Larkinella soli]